MPKILEEPNKQAERDLAVLRHVAASPGLSVANAPKGYKTVIGRLVKTGLMEKRDGLCYLTEGGQRRVGRFNGLLPNVCKACMRWPCACERDAQEAGTLLAAERQAALPEVKTVTLVKGADRWSFSKLPDGEVLQVFLGPKRIEKRIVPYTEAKGLYNDLKAKGWK